VPRPNPLPQCPPFTNAAGLRDGFVYPLRSLGDLLAGEYNPFADSQSLIAAMADFMREHALAGADVARWSQAR
jgi:hypothetical protein